MSWLPNLKSKRVRYDLKVSTRTEKIYAKRPV